MRFKAQTKWRWGVATYLALVGLGAGGYVVGVLADFRGAEWANLAKYGIALGFPCCALAGLTKLGQLGNPSAAWRAWMRPGTSWIARGSLLLMAFMGLSFLSFVLWIWPSTMLEESEGLRRLIGFLGGLTGVAMLLYTGILLTAARPIAFWSTAMVPLLFFLSGLAAGVFGIVLIATIAGVEFGDQLQKLTQAGVVLAVIKGLAVGVYLQSSHRVSEARASVARVVGGELKALFWVGVVLVGLVGPVLFGLLALAGGTGMLAALAALCLLVGSLCLRQVVLAGGIHAPLRAGAFEVALPIV